MTTEPIIESGMTFGPYLDGHFFRIEKTATLDKINKGAKPDEGVKIAEFLLLRMEGQTPTIWVIEAKNGSPQPAKQADFDKFIHEVKDKLSNSLLLFLAIYLKRHSTELELPPCFQKIDLSTTHFKFVLIITSNTYKEEWLPPLQDALLEVLNPIVKRMVKMWNLSSSDVIVMNQDIAKKNGLHKDLD
ncbi:MAG: hypothetical protein HOP34_11275 [Methylococcaceae bacterium]|nr:hypothetical protein [Methylococcaceae bacterium]